MPEAKHPVMRQLVRHEMHIVLLLVALAFISIPVAHGGLELGWDALNHHIYLGWTAEAHRFDLDFLAASWQSLQFPYLYWPAYRMAASGFSGTAAGMVLAALQALIAVPAWMLARTCMPGQTLFDVALRVLAVTLSLTTSVTLLLVNTTNNDILSAIPMLWAIALAVAPLDAARARWLTPSRSVLLSGALAGAAVACKWSNGPLAILLPALWLLAATAWPQRLRLAALGCLATLVVFVLLYGPWGWLLWKYFGNPMYPMYDHYFQPVREWMGWRP